MKCTSLTRLALVFKAWKRLVSVGEISLVIRLFHFGACAPECWGIVLLKHTRGVI